MEIFVHPYIPMILPISSQCGTLVVYPTPSSSTAYLTPTLNGQPSGVGVERVPTEDNSMMVLETSAGKGLSFEDPTT
jgi:hypothetical protein